MLRESARRRGLFALCLLSETSNDSLINSSPSTPHDVMDLCIICDVMIFCKKWHDIYEYHTASYEYNTAVSSTDLLLVLL